MGGVEVGGTEGSRSQDKQPQFINSNALAQPKIANVQNEAGYTARKDCPQIRIFILKPNNNSIQEDINQS